MKMNDDISFVSVVIPCLNEEKYIGKCLESLLANDYPNDKLEILVVDGLSRDRTRDVVKGYSNKYPFIRLCDNVKKITPCALNVGIKKAKGDVIVRVDAHSTYEVSYITKCVTYLKEYDVDNVGGAWTIVPGRETFLAKAITLVSSHPFGVGNAHYRIGQKKEPSLVDTVPYGCFRRDIFDRIGFFDEAFHRNEDIEFNSRIRKLGGKILLVPDITIKYYARSGFTKFTKHMFDNGTKVTYPFALHKGIFSGRHMIPMVFVTGILFALFLIGCSPFYSIAGVAGVVMLVGIMGAYATTAILFSAQSALREKNIELIFLMPIVFFLLHVSYGIGSICGMVRSGLQAVLSLFFLDNEPSEERKRYEAL